MSRTVQRGEGITKEKTETILLLQEMELIV
jgi:hypothetical protein